MPILIDTHTHVDFLIANTNESLDSFYNTCIQHNVAHIILMGVYKEQFTDISNLYHAKPDLFSYALGLHPLFIQEHHLTSHLDDLYQLVENDPHCIAIGEIGLDKYQKELITPEKWNLQCHYFETQLQIAQTFKLPVSIHARRCHNEIYTFLKKYTVTGVIHGFSGSYQEAKRYIDLGFKLGIGGVITYPRAIKTRNTVKQLPIDALVLETDAPDMPVYQQQGLMNHPKNINLIFTGLQSLLSMNSDILAQQLLTNSSLLFRLNTQF